MDSYLTRGITIPDYPLALTGRQLLLAATPLLTAVLLLVLASTAILGLQCHGSHDHILLSD